MKFLTKNLMQTPRKPKELWEWVNEAIEKMGSNSQGKTALRLTEGLAKELVEELLPLGYFGVKHFRDNPEVIITPSIDNGNYDARVQGDEGQIEYIEITQAHEGHDHHLRMKKLDEEGQVSAIGKVSKSGNKKVGYKTNVQREARYAEDLKNEEWRRVIDAATRKAKKFYPANTALVISFNGKLLLPTPEYEEEVNHLIQNELTPRLKHFALVALALRNICLDSWFSG